MLGLICQKNSGGSFSLRDCNGIWTHNQLVYKQPLNCSVKLASLAWWLSVRLRNKWLWVRIPLQSLKYQISRLFWARSSLTFDHSRVHEKRTVVSVIRTWFSFTIPDGKAIERILKAMFRFEFAKMIQSKAETCD